MMKRHLPNLTTSPSGGWRYKVPETGQDFIGSSLSELMGNLAAHYKAAGYPLPPNLLRLVEDYICEEVPEACGGQPRASRDDDMSKAGWIAGLKHTFTNVLAGTRTLGAWFVGGRKFVDQDLANQRASVCIHCPENVEAQGCTNCNINTLHEAVRSVIGSRTTVHDGRLHACKVCLCDLRTKVHFPHDVLWMHMADSQKQALPPHCWLIHEHLESIEESSTLTSLSGGITVITAPPLT